MMKHALLAAAAVALAGCSVSSDWLSFGREFANSRGVDPIQLGEEQQMVVYAQCLDRYDGDEDPEKWCDEFVKILAPAETGEEVVSDE